jgi:hypothetical protein
MMIVGSEPGPVFLFSRDPDESVRLRGEVGTCVSEVRTFGLDAIGLRTACAIVRAGGVAPSVLLLEQEHRDASALEPRGPARSTRARCASRCSATADRTPVDSRATMAPTGSSTLGDASSPKIRQDVRWPVGRAVLDS